MQAFLDLNADFLQRRRINHHRSKPLLYQTLLLVVPHQNAGAIGKDVRL
jgi:hypothetical protein